MGAAIKETDTLYTTCTYISLMNKRISKKVHEIFDRNRYIAQSRYALSCYLQTCLGELVKKIPITSDIFPQRPSGSQRSRILLSVFHDGPSPDPSQYGSPADVVTSGCFLLISDLRRFEREARNLVPDFDMG